MAAAYLGAATTTLSLASFSSPPPPLSSLSSVASLALRDLRGLGACPPRHPNLPSVPSPKQLCRSTVDVENLELDSEALEAFDRGFYEIPTVEGIPVGNKLKLFNLPYNCDRQAIIDHLGTRGAIVESLEITNNDEEGNASGIVALGSFNQACTAVDQLDGASFQGKCVRMDFVERRPHETVENRFHARSTSSVYRIYIGNLPWRMDDASLEQLFSVHGTVQEARIMKERETGRSRGFGFVAMSTAAEMEKAIAALNGSEIEGRTLRVNLAESRDAARF